MIAFTCASCQKKISVKDELAGKKGKCLACGHPMTIPKMAVAGDASQSMPSSSSWRETRTLPPKDRGQANLESRVQGAGQTNPGYSPKREAASSTHVQGLDQERYDFLAPPEQPDEIGRLGPYRVLQVLGAGGMGVVFRAEDPGLQRLVALKAMLPALACSPSAKERFFREARSVAALKHPNVVTIHQVGEDRGSPFLAMEFLQGESLEDRLKRDTSLPLLEILRIGREIAEGLAAAHAKGLIHRDVKPANIWLEGPAGHVKILDFGLARARSDQGNLTQSGAIIGTPAYMAPEQAGGEAVDHHCDLFSLGCVLYRTCTGEMAFKGANTMAILSALALHDPLPPAELNAEVPVELSDLVMELLSKKANGRPKSARMVVERLKELATADSHEITKPLVSLPRVKAQKVRPIRDILPSRVQREGSARAPLEGEGSVLPAWFVPAAAAVVGLVLVTFLGVLAYQTFSRTVDKATAEIAVTGGEPSKPSSPSGETPPPDSPIPLVPGDPDSDRKAALWVLSIGKPVVVVKLESPDSMEEIRTPDDLPDEPFYLTGVKIHQTNQFTDEGLARLKNCKNLRTLEIHETAATDAGLAHIKDCKNLTHLSLSGTKLTDAGLVHFKDCKNLTSLGLGGSQMTDAGLASFKDCKNLMYIDVGNSKIGDAGLANFKDCQDLRSLWLGDTLVTDAGLAYFADCKKLNELYLDNTQVGDAGLAHLKDCYKLGMIRLYGTKVTDAGLAYLKDCKALTNIMLVGTRVGDAGLAHLKDSKVLGALDLQGLPVGDTGLAHLKNCKKLSTLILKDTLVTDAGLAHLKDCKNLQTLHLQGTRVSDPGMAHLQGCKNLSYLNLNDTKVGDAGLASLKQCQKLSQLNLKGTLVSDASLPNFRDWLKLHQVDLRNTAVTRPKLAELRKAMPKCDFYED